MKTVQALVAALGLAATASSTAIVERGDWGHNEGNGTTAYLFLHDLLPDPNEGHHRHQDLHGHQQPDADRH
jgi:hypothetical protein